MDNVMSALQVRTAIPFGYLFLATSWIVGMSALAVILRRKIHRSEVAGVGFVASLAGLCFGALAFFANVVYPDKIKFNPLVSEEDLVGSWILGSSRFDFGSESKATFLLESELGDRLGISNGDGFWKKTSRFSISIGNQSVPQTAKMRVIRVGDELRIIIQDYADLDMWDGDLGFRKSTN